MWHAWLLGLGLFSLSFLQSAPRWQLGDVEPLRDRIGQIDGRPAYLVNAMLSPDGRLVAWQQERETCVYAFASDAATCFDWPEAAAFFADRYNQPSWSPDSRTIAYGETFFTMGDDSDLWTLDVSTGVYTDHTDDGFAGNARLTREGQEMPIDYAPTWNPATGELYFFHSERRTPLFVDSNYTLQLFKLTPGGQPQRVRDLTLAVPGPLSLYSPPAFNADGTQLAFLALPYGWQTVPGAGLWVLDLAHGTTEVRVPASALLQALPAWVGPNMSPLKLQWAGDDLVIWMEANSLDSPMFRTPLYYDSATGRVTTLIDYSAVADAEAYTTARVAEPYTYYSNPLTGIRLPGADHYWMLAAGPIGEGMSVFEMPLPGDGGQPRLLTAIDQQLGPGEDALPTLSADGKLLMLHTLFTLEPAGWAAAQTDQLKVTSAE